MMHERKEEEEYPDLFSEPLAPNTVADKIRKNRLETQEADPVSRKSEANRPAKRDARNSERLGERMRRFRSQRSVLQYAHEQWMQHVASMFRPEEDAEDVVEHYSDPRNVRIARPGELPDYAGGRCDGIEIVLARDLHSDGDEDVMEAVAHEIAHVRAIALYFDYTHGERWRKEAESLGCRNFRQYEEEQAGIARGFRRLVRKQLGGLGVAVLDARLAGNGATSPVGSPELGNPDDHVVKWLVCRIGTLAREHAEEFGDPEIMSRIERAMADGEEDVAKGRAVVAAKAKA